MNEADYLMKNYGDRGRRVLILTRNVIKVNHKWNTHHKCNNLLTISVINY